MTDPQSTINRGIPGRLFEQYFGQATEGIERELVRRTGIQINTPRSVVYDRFVEMTDAGVNELTQYLIDAYKIFSPELYAAFADGRIPSDAEAMRHYFSEVFEKGFGMFKPVWQDVPPWKMVQDAEKSQFRPTYDVITCEDEDGVKYTSLAPVRIGEVYYGLLEKTGDDWAACSSPRFNIMQVIAQLTKADKYTNPARQQSARGPGEAENRIFAANCTGRWVAELSDRATSKQTHTEMIWNLYDAENPSNVKSLVNRDNVPFGKARPNALTNHLLNAMGIGFGYVSEEGKK